MQSGDTYATFEVKFVFKIYLFKVTQLKNPHQ